MISSLKSGASRLSLRGENRGVDGLVSRHWRGVSAGFLMALLLLSGSLVGQSSFPQPQPAPGERPRVIVTTDGEIDDRCSMVRFLMYANEFEIEGIIYSSSRFHWLGQTWSGVEWIHAYIDHYDQVLPSLRRHAEGFPSAAELKDLVYVGNITNVGEMETDTPGSDRIVEVLLDDEPGPVYLQAWGGTNTIARALWVIQNEHPEQMEKVSEKAIIYIILDQDETFREYIEPNWPRLQVLGSFRQFRALAYGAREIIPYPEKVFFLRPWMEGNILMDHGNLTAVYEPVDGAFRSEGDSPSFMHQIRVGLRSLENPGYGGWGGRFVQERPGQTNVWKGAEDDSNLDKPIWRWAEAFQHDWAARADWCVKDYDEANHPPIVILEGSADRQANPGERAVLDLSRSGDPDGDALRYRWWHYREAGSYRGEVDLTSAGSAVATVEVPADMRSGETLHIIGEVKDSGKPPLTRYARVIVTVPR